MKAVECQDVALNLWLTFRVFVLQARDSLDNAYSSYTDSQNNEPCACVNLMHGRLCVLICQKCFKCCKCSEEYQYSLDDRNHFASPACWLSRFALFILDFIFYLIVLIGHTILTFGTPFYFTCNFIPAFRARHSLFINNWLNIFSAMLADYRFSLDEFCTIWAFSFYRLSSRVDFRLRFSHKSYDQKSNRPEKKPPKKPPHRAPSF